MSGAASVLQKPIRMTELRSKVQEMLQEAPGYSADA
jgi:hypothetical protein